MRSGWGLKRLAAVYGLVERMRSGELRLAAAAVAEVERASQAEMALRDAERMAARRALAAGDGVEWAVAGTSVDFAEERIGRLAELKAQREDDWRAAVTAHAESRVAKEQMESVMARARKAKMDKDARQGQAASDDRFGGQAWSRARSERKGGMSGS